MFTRIITRHVKFHFDLTQGQRVAQRDEFAGAFGALDAGDPGGREHVTLGDSAAGDFAQRCRSHAQTAFRHRAPRRLRLAGNVHHVRFPSVIDVAESAHRIDILLAGRTPRCGIIRGFTTEAGMPSGSTNKVIVGLSGGVDSAVAALLLQQEGYDVAGLFMKNWDEDDGTEYCTAQADYEDAQRVSAHLGIELHTANFAAEYWDNVFQEFLTGYAAGLTPNPDVLCNREIKFNLFLDYAQALGAERIATGHYVQGHTGEDGFELHKASDANKDQSYFLQAVPLAQLQPCLFPLGHLQKRKVRRMAAEAGLHNHRKKDSTGICFIGERRFRDFLDRYLTRAPGLIVDTEGVGLGEHIGLSYYTLGQRQGLGIGGRAGAAQAPWYVVEKDLTRNVLVVTQVPADLDSTWLATPAVNWLAPHPELPMRCSAKVRYRQNDQPCTVYRRADGQLGVRFDTPQRAVTPGQYVCFYDQRRCLGGGPISRTGRVA